MKLKTLLISAGLSLTLGVCAFAGISASRNNIQKANAENQTLTFDSFNGLPDGWPMYEPTISFQGYGFKYYGASTDSYYGYSTNSGFTFHRDGSGYLNNTTAMPGNIVDITLYTFSSQSKAITYHIGFGTGELNGKNSSNGDTHAIAAGSNETFTPAINNALYFSIYCDKYSDCWSAIDKIVVTYEEPAPDPVYKTFYFDYTAVPGWGTDATTKLETNDGTRYATEVAYSGSNVLKATIDVASVTNVKFVRLKTADLSVKWNETPEQAVFDCNYCNVYDNSGYSYGWTIAKSVKVLDITGTSSLIATNHYAHIWDSNSSDAASTTWPGRAMNQIGSSRFYEITFKNNFNKIIFDNNSGQTANLDVNDGKVWVLQNDWDGAWVSEAAAEFIDSYLKFDTIDTSTDTQGTACKAGWSDLFTAYTTTYASERADIISVPHAKARLAAWAEANGATFNPDNGTLSATSSLTIVSQLNSNNSTMIIIVVTSLVLISVGGFFFIRKRKEN